MTVHGEGDKKAKRESDGGKGETQSEGTRVMIRREKKNPGVGESHEGTRNKRRLKSNHRKQRNKSEEVKAIDWGRLLRKDEVKWGVEWENREGGIGRHETGTERLYPRRGQMTRV